MNSRRSAWDRIADDEDPWVAPARVEPAPAIPDEEPKPIITHVRDAGRLWVALYTWPPSNLSHGTEVSGAGYARQPVFLSVSTGHTRTRGITAISDGDVVFPRATSHWGTIMSFGILDAQAGGFLLSFGALDSTINVYLGDTVRLNAGSLRITGL